MNKDQQKQQEIEKRPTGTPGTNNIKTQNVKQLYLLFSWR